MEKREKILLVLVLLALTYGAYAYLFTGGEGPTIKDFVNLDEVNKAKAEVEKRVNANPLTEHERYRLELAERPWPRDPFYDRSTDKVDERDVATEMPPEIEELRYTGYISIGKETFAIINEMEYREGDELEVAGFFVVSISRTMVEIGRKDETGAMVGQKQIFLEDVSF